MSYPILHHDIDRDAAGAAPCDAKGQLAMDGPSRSTGLPKALRTGRAMAATFMAIMAVTLALTDVVPAKATTREASCSELQQAIDQTASEAHGGEGDVVVLNGLCNAPELGGTSGVTLPGGSNFTIEGKPGTTSGFDGTGIAGSLLGTGNEEAGAMAINGLTFEHAALTNASALSIKAARLELDGDNFLEDEERGQGAHAAFVQIGQSNCPAATGPPALIVSHSTFATNKLVLESIEGGGGGAAWFEDPCAASRNVLEDDVFEGNTLEAAGTAEGALVTGAGLQFEGNHAQTSSVTQSGDVFDSNAIVAAAPAVADYGGGGEWLEYAQLASVGDRFSRNTIAGTSSASYEMWSWGAGLGINNLPMSCDEAALPASTLEDDVVTGNAIGPGNTADLGGGGIWVGCAQLHVLDSTFTLNSAPYGAGIEGEAGTRLVLANSIVAGDGSGDETTGFGEPGGSVTAEYSDVCASAGSSDPLAGTGNICANPLLADNADSSSFDVHETASSPTIDVGSNALLPAGVNTDFYGDIRVQAGRYETPECIPPGSAWPILGASIVDMGASEYTPNPPSEPASCPAKPEQPAGHEPGTGQEGGTGHEPGNQQTPTGPQRTTTAGSTLQSSPSAKTGSGSSYRLLRPRSISTSRAGVLVFRFGGLTTGRLDVRATVKQFRRGSAGDTETTVYGTVGGEVDLHGDLLLRLLPTRTALTMLTRRKRLLVHLSITLMLPGLAPSSREATMTVVYRPPARRRSGAKR